MRAQSLAPVMLVALVAAGCGGARAARTGHTVTFVTGGAFPTATIVGRYSAAGCAHDARAIVHDAQLYYAHSTTAPGPADLYYYDMRFDVAHLQADDCTSAQLGAALARGLTRRQRGFLLRNVASNLRRAFARPSTPPRRRAGSRRAPARSSPAAASPWGRRAASGATGRPALEERRSAASPTAITRWRSRSATGRRLP